MGALPLLIDQFVETDVTVLGNRDTWLLELKVINPLYVVKWYGPPFGLFFKSVFENVLRSIIKFAEVY